MKFPGLCVTVVAVACLGGLALAARSDAQQDSKREWRQLLQQDVSMYATAAGRGPLDGAPGASAIGFRVSNDVQGGALIVGLDAPVLGVFVGLNVPDKHIDEPCADLCVDFTLADGTTRRVAPAGGGGTSMLFTSPEDVPVSSLRSVTLSVDARARWAK